MAGKENQVAAEYERRHPKITIRVTPELLAKLQQQAMRADPRTSVSAIVLASVTRPSPAASIFLKLFNTLGARDPGLARELFESLSREEQVMLREFLESN